MEGIDEILNGNYLRVMSAPFLEDRANSRMIMLFIIFLLYTLTYVFMIFLGKGFLSELLGGTKSHLR